MEINIIKEKAKLNNLIVKGNDIFEGYRDSDDDFYMNAFIFSDENKTLKPILEDQIILSQVKIYNAIWNSRDIYYASYFEIDPGIIQIHKYNVSEEKDEIFISIFDNFDISDPEGRLKVFILSNSHALVQYEKLNREKTNELMGNIEFSLKLYNAEKYEDSVIEFTDFKNNGINSIIPCNDSKIMIKTGYSYLDDNRSEKDEESEALIESVYITTTSLFVSELQQKTGSNILDLLISTYYTKHITTPKIDGDYIHFSVVDAKNGSERSYFYNFNTGEQLEYETDDIDDEDKNITCVIDNVPYVRISKNDVVNFINLKTAEVSFSFFDEVFVYHKNKLFFLKPKSSPKKTRIYSYPKLKLEYEGKMNVDKVVCIDDRYYVYI